MTISAGDEVQKEGAIYTVAYATTKRKGDILVAWKE
jgi:hypothetical protein